MNNLRKILEISNKRKLLIQTFYVIQLTEYRKQCHAEGLLNGRGHVAKEIYRQALSKP